MPDRATRAQYEAQILNLTRTSCGPVTGVDLGPVEDSYEARMSDNCRFQLPFAAVQFMTNEELNSVFGTSRNRQSPRARDAYEAWMTGRVPITYPQPRPRDVRTWLADLNEFSTAPAVVRTPPAPEAPAAQEPLTITVGAMPSLRDYQDRSAYTSLRQTADNGMSWTDRGRVFVRGLAHTGITIPSGVEPDRFGRVLKSMFSNLEADYNSLARRYREVQQNSELQVVTARTARADAIAEAAKAKAETEKLTTIRDAALAWRDKGKGSVEKLALFNQMLASIDSLQTPEEAPAETTDFAIAG